MELSEGGGHVRFAAGMVTDSERGARSEQEELARRLLSELKPRIADLRPFPTRIPVADSTSKFLGFDRCGRALAVVICSPSLFPDTVAQHLELKKRAWSTLGAWGDVILLPFQTGTVDGLSFAAFPHCRSLSESRYAWVVEREWIRPRVLEWLRGATEITASDTTDREREEAFGDPLEYLVSWTAMPIELRSAAAVALQRLREGVWKPRHCLMHGDLWKGNILLEPANRGFRKFVLIDWGALLIRGYGIYDLLTLADSTRLRGRRLAKEVQAHCEVLSCDFMDARSHLLAALGYTGKHLGYFPFPNYVAMSLTRLRQLISIGG